MGLAMTRKHIGLKTKLAATLRELFRIPYDHAKLMSEDQVIALAHFDHAIYHAQGGGDDHHNLTPMLIAGHREKTAKIDIPQIAKTKRLSKEHEEFQRRILTPRDERPKKKRSIPSRPFPSRKAKT